MLKERLTRIVNKVHARTQVCEQTGLAQAKGEDVIAPLIVAW